MTIDEYNKLCAALPVDVNWGDPITPEVVAAILESRASNAGRAVYQALHVDTCTWEDVTAEYYTERLPSNRRILYTRPAPASKEPVAFDPWFNEQIKSGNLLSYEDAKAGWDGFAETQTTVTGGTVNLDLTGLSTHPAPASTEPVADERCNRCGHENHSGACVNVHPDKTPIKQESTLDGLRDCLQKMVDANLEDSLGPNHLALCLKQMAYEALELIQKVQPVADERGASEFDSPLSDFQEGQWWVKELDAMPGTDDQKRAIAVVHHMLRSARAALATAQTWQPIETAPRNVPVLVLASGQQFVAWFQDDATDEMYDERFGGSDHNKSWCVTDNKHGPYALRGGRPTHWMPLPAAPAKPEGV